MARPRKRRTKSFPYPRQQRITSRSTMAKRRAKAKMTQAEVAKKYGFRSSIELEVNEFLAKNGYNFMYEGKVIRFEQPAKKRRYTPDFVLFKPDGSEMIIETKGRFLTQDRLKIKMVLEQYPDLDLRIVFDSKSNSLKPINSTSKKLVSDWCDDLDIPWAVGTIPEEWLNEAKNPNKPFG